MPKPSNGIHQNQGQSRGWAPLQVSEVKLPFLPWICPPPLSSKDRQDSFVAVITLTDFTSSNNILESISEFCPLK
jgi:hypothetical protein